MPNQKNKQIVSDLKEKIAKSKSVIFTQYIGLSSNSMNDLREKLRNKGAQVEVAKNTLIKLALKESGMDTSDLDKDLKGSTATVFSYIDPMSPIKEIVDFAKEIELPKLKSAFIEGVYTDSEKLEIISQLPSKEQLIAQVLGGLKSPLSGLVYTLGGVQKKFVYVLSAVSQKQSN